MAFCINCGNPLPENATFCEKCGAPVVNGTTVPATYMQAYVDPSDHTAEFDPADIAENKIYAMAAYLMGVPGILIALLAAKDSKFTGFHCRQALKFQVAAILLGIVIALLCWTVIVPIIGGIAVLGLVVIEIICFVQACSGKAKDAPLLNKIPFLK